MSESKRIDPKYRDILAWILKSDKSARAAYKHFLRLNAWNIRPDYMLVRNSSGTYDRLPDYEAWNASVPRFGTVSMLKGKGGDWFVHGG